MVISPLSAALTNNSALGLKQQSLHTPGCGRHFVKAVVANRSVIGWSIRYCSFFVNASSPLKLHPAAYLSMLDAYGDPPPDLHWRVGYRRQLLRNGRQKMLTPDDFEILLHAVDLWTQEPDDIYAKRSLMSLVLASAAGKSEKDMIDLAEQEHGKAKDEIRVRTEQAIFLKARLIKLKDKLEVSKFLGDLADDD